MRHVTLRWLEKETRRERLLGENVFLARETLLPREESNRNVKRSGERVLALAPDVLTPRQLHVVTLMLNGTSSPEIAEVLKMAESTVRVHRAAAVQRLRAAMGISGGGENG